MGVIIAVTICPNGALVVVIPERYPQPGAQSSRHTVTPAGNPARARFGAGLAGPCAASSGMASPRGLVARPGSAVPDDLGQLSGHFGQGLLRLLLVREGLVHRAGD